MIHRANMDKNYWTYALNYKVYSFVEKQFRGKIDERAKVYLGFAENSETYIVGVVENGATKKIETRSVSFNEDEFYFGAKEGQPNVNNIPFSRVHDTLVVGDDVSFNAKNEPSLTVTKVPSSVQEAVEDPQWKEAIKGEFDSLCSNKVWTLEQLPKGPKPLKRKWHFTMKHNENGSFKKCRARFVAKSFSQVEGRNYLETYSPTARMSTIQILLNLAAQYQVKPRQMDINTAYLNADVEENIYMEQPQGFEVKDNEGNQVYCKLRKSICGLKQSGRNCYLTLKTFLERIGFRACINDKCLFAKGTGDELGVVCGWGVNMLYWGRQGFFVQWLEKKVKDQFELSDCSSLHWFLGMKIDVREGEIAVNQEKYIVDLLKRYNMEECKPVQSPLPENIKFERESNKEQDYDEQSIRARRDYRELVGSLNYLALSCRPDIAHASHVLKRFLEHPSKEHYMAAKRNLRYFKGTKQHELVFRMCEGDVTVCAFSDADWAGELTWRKSTSGVCVQLNSVSGCVCWTSKMQASVALSTAKAEVNACTVALQELEYVGGVLTD